jgi:hypothetical protein
MLLSPTSQSFHHVFTDLRTAKQAVNTVVATLWSINYLLLVWVKSKHNWAVAGEYGAESAAHRRSWYSARRDFAHLIHMIANVIKHDVDCTHRTAPHTYDHLTTYIPFILIFIKTEWAYCTCRCHSEPLWLLFRTRQVYLSKCRSSWLVTLLPLLIFSIYSVWNGNGCIAMRKHIP